MARRLTDGAELKDISMVLKYGTHNGCSIEVGDWRSGAACYELGSGGYSHLTVSVYSDWGWMDEIYIRWGLKIGSNPGNIFYVKDSGNGDCGYIAYGNNSIALYSPGNNRRDDWVGVETQKWYLFEVYFKMHDTNGVFKVKVDGHEVLSWEGDTKYGSPDYINTFLFGCNSYQNIWIDDIAVNDTSGSDQNSWCGDGHVLLLTAGSDGDNTSFTPSSGSINADMVDEIAPDGDTTYNYTSGSGNYDLLNVEQSGLSGVIIPVVHPIIVAKETTAAGELIDTGLKVGGTEYWDLYNHAILASYVPCLGKPYYNNPSGGAWTVAALNNLQIGYKSK